MAIPFLSFFKKKAKADAPAPMPVAPPEISARFPSSLPDILAPRFHRAGSMLARHRG